MKLSQILREEGKKFVKIQLDYTDGVNGRCALGVLMEHFGWNGKKDVTGLKTSHAYMEIIEKTLYDISPEYNSNIISSLNDDTDLSFSEMADWLEARGI